jgi:hypothetical protein
MREIESSARLSRQPDPQLVPVWTESSVGTSCVPSSAPRAAPADNESALPRSVHLANPAEQVETNLPKSPRAAERQGGRQTLSATSIQPTAQPGRASTDRGQLVSLEEAT